MEPEERVPALPLTACLLAGPVLASPLVAFATSDNADSLLRIWGTLTLFGLCDALFIGTPIALLLLRDPALLWRHWIGAAVLAGLITTAIILGWTALSSTRHLLAGQWGAFQVLMLWLVVPLVTFSAAVSRILLALWLRRRSSTAR